ncbi:MAG TPA: CaiB/BaiF CoA-transferase family protein [Longimicrobiales bacterium]|nr:CaiB/BaiF CoA-transferase family protein [Longimicrobiales bacterium]
MTACGPRPLAGLRVVELAQNLAGPYCGQILRDLGADVVKVERPGIGDAARAWGPPFIDGAGSIFAATNRGKRSIALDLKNDDDRTVLQALIRQADVLVEAFRPGVFQRLGYGWDVVHKWNPRLIYCSVGAYGEVGPLRDLPGYDPLMQAHGGLLSVTGESGGDGVRVGTSVIDMGTGLWLTIGVLAALRHRDTTGSGMCVSSALYDTALAWNAYHVLGYLADGTVPEPMGTELPMIAPYGVFPTSDGGLMIAAANDNLFRKLCVALQLGGVDDKFRTNPLRVRHRAEINGIVSAATSRHTTAELLEVLRDSGVPSAPVQDMAEVVADPQTAASGMICQTESGPAVALPIRLDGARQQPGDAVPRPGEHTTAIRRELDPGAGG